jgi:hypothetical protein
MKSASTKVAFIFGIEQIDHAVFLRQSKIMPWQQNRQRWPMKNLLSWSQSVTRLYMAQRLRSQPYIAANWSRWATWRMLRAACGWPRRDDFGYILGNLPAKAALLVAEFALEPRLHFFAMHRVGVTTINAAEHSLAVTFRQYQLHRPLALWADGRIGLNLGHRSLTLDQAGAQGSQSPMVAKGSGGDTAAYRNYVRMAT